MEKNKCIIIKGKHRSTCSKFRLHFGKKEIIKRVTFTESCEYNIHEQWEINKLFGLSYGFSGKNSVRFGWRWSVNTNRIEIFSYVCVDGVLKYQKICDIQWFEEREYRIITTDDHYRLVVTNPFNNESESVIISKIKTSRWGYYLYPSFGEDETAPHSMCIEIENISDE